MNKNPALVKHILDAIKTINEYIAKRTFDDFCNNQIIVDAVVFQFMIIGEASTKLSNSFHEKHSDIPFHQIIGLRNKIVHAYWIIDTKVIWDAYKNDLPELKKKLLKAI
ncbi:MAG TPA: HepT-like ribonuclease domain-containing protein [Candidatus Andersenbacteria bacterium]|nr:HepT-like ribonuclease domain-containing protein [Candidatus Andersenbacteria bacterium]